MRFATPGGSRRPIFRIMKLRRRIQQLYVYVCGLRVQIYARNRCLYVCSRARDGLTQSRGMHTLNMYAVRTTAVARMRLKLLRVTAPYGNQHVRNIV